MNDRHDPQLLPPPEVQPLVGLIEMRPFARATRSLRAGTLLALDRRTPRFNVVMASMTLPANIEVSKNTICLWYDGTALGAAKFYAETFPDSAEGAVHRAPGDYRD